MKFFIVPDCISKVPPTPITTSTTSRLPSPYILGKSPVSESSVISNVPKLDMVNVGLFIGAVESSLKINFEPCNSTVHPSISMSPAKTIVAPLKT